MYMLGLGLSHWKIWKIENTVDETNMNMVFDFYEF